MSQLGWQALLLIPLLAAIIGLVRVLRRRQDDRPKAPIIRFFLASLLVHFGLLFALDLVLITVPVVEAHREFLAEVVLKTFSVEPVFRARPPAWERLAEGPPVTEPLPDLTPAPVAELTFATELKDMAPTVSEAVARSLPPSRLLFIPRTPSVPNDPPAVDLPRSVAMGPDLPVLEAPLLQTARPVPEREPETPVIAVEHRAEALPASSAPLPSRPTPLPTPPSVVALVLARTDVARTAPPPPTVDRPSRIVPTDDLELPAPRRTDPTRTAKEDTSIEPRATDLPLPRVALRELPESDRSAPVNSGLKTAARVEPRTMARELKMDPSLPSLPPPRFKIDAALLHEEHEPTIQFAMRQPEARKDVVPTLGGSAASEAAVARGLTWLAAHQGSEGNWSFHDLHCRGHECDSIGGTHSDPAATGLVLMAFLGAGHAPNQGPHAELVRLGIAFLVSRQKKDGELAEAAGITQMYSHAFATIALCEAFGLSGDRTLREPAERALRFIVEAQDPKGGGWRYKPREEGDTSVFGWQVMALKSGEMAGLTVPAEVYTRARHWLDSVGTGPDHLLYGYQPGREATPSMTAEALLCRQYLGLPRDAKTMVAGGAYLKAHLPDWKSRHAYYWYYGTQVMFHIQGEPWNAWNAKLRDMLVDAQTQDGPAAGSWHPYKPGNDRWGTEGGRLYETALSLLMLEVYYRHLPLYQQLGATTPSRDSKP